MSEAMSEKQLLEAAAKAAGIKGKYSLAGRCIVTPPADPPGFSKPWNPLTNDGDALRLAVSLHCRKGFQLTISEYGASVRIGDRAGSGCEAQLHSGIESATRRAIVLAAAQLSKENP